MSKLNGAATDPSEDEKLFGDDKVRNKVTNKEKKPEKNGKALLSIFQAKKKKQRKFDENETIDCVSKGLF